MGGCGSKDIEEPAAVDAICDTNDPAPDINMGEMPFSPSHMPFSPTYKNGKTKSGGEMENGLNSNAKTFAFDSPEAVRKPESTGGKTTQTNCQVLEEPPILQSFLDKQGHRVKNWKTRYFVLAAGVLRYYELPDSSPPFGIHLKGELTQLEAYTLSEDESTIPPELWKSCDHDACYLYLTPSNRPTDASVDLYPDLLLQFDEAQRMTVWFAALKTHIAYKKASAGVTDR